MRFPLSTGHAARLLRTTEPRLGEAVRQGKVDPAPPIVAGRRLWSAEHILAAAVALDALTADLAQELRRAEGSPEEHLCLSDNSPPAIARPDGEANPR